MKTKSKVNNRLGISLIILVVTILVLVIIAAAVIISLSKGDVMGQATKTTFKQDMAKYKEAYELHVTSKFADNPQFDRDGENITCESSEYEKVFGDVPAKYNKNLMVVTGKLVYKTEDELEIEILKELGILWHVGETSVPEGAISKDESYVGYYVDADGNGEVDGIIFADLIEGKSNEQWSDAGGSFSYSAVKDKSKLKDYVKSENKHKDVHFGENYVLKVTGDINRQDRFYVMALTDIITNSVNGDQYTWYDAAYEYTYNNGSSSGIPNPTTLTSTSFGAGKENTESVAEKWNNSAFGKQNNRDGFLDAWAVFKPEITGYTLEDGWFIPSKEEWCAFAKAFSIDKDNYSSTYGLRGYYWSSSLYNSFGVWYMNFANEFASSDWIIRGRSIRLATTY